MNISVSVQLVMQYAAREAITAHFGDIMPEHLFIALLKCSELPHEQIWSVTADPEVRDVLLNDVADLQNAVRERSIDPKAARRTVRQQLGKGDVAYRGGELHRSRASKEVFDRAAQLADAGGDDVLVPAHMLQALCAAPTPVIAALLKAIIPSRQLTLGASWLATHGVDVLADAAAPELPSVRQRKGELMAFMQALSSDTFQSVIAVGESPFLPRALLLAILRDPAATDMPKSMRGLCVMAIGDPRQAFSDSVFTAEAIAELEHRRKTVLLVPLRERIDGTPTWLQRMLHLAARNTVRFVLDVSPPVFAESVSPAWQDRKFARVMHFEAEAADAIPNEL